MASFASSASAGAQDPMVAAIMDPALIEMISTLVAKLERIAHDEGRTGVFRTPWARDIFGECIRRHTGPKDAMEIDIEAWYRTALAEFGPPKSKRNTGPKTDPTLYVSSIDTNWILALMKAEMELGKPGFMRILHNVLELEDRAQNKLAEYCKQERQYDFLGVNMTRNTAATPLIAAAPAPAPERGSVEDLLKNTGKKRAN